jgi:predicted dehydrogenase
MLRVGVVGYGTGGRHFHTPFIAAAKNCILMGKRSRFLQASARPKISQHGALNPSPIGARFTPL